MTWLSWTASQADGAAALWLLRPLLQYCALLAGVAACRWYLCDDAWVVGVEESVVKSVQAYLLFYCRRGMANPT